MVENIHVGKSQFVKIDLKYISARFYLFLRNFKIMLLYLISFTYIQGHCLAFPGWINSVVDHMLLFTLVFRKQALV
jgi:hypothetical protein